MTLNDLGFDAWLDGHVRTIGRTELSPGRVVRVERDRYLIRNEHSEVLAEPTGKLLFGVSGAEDLPCVGDWVLVQYYDNGDLAIIHELLPRKGLMKRKSPGRRIDVQLIAANVDVAFIIQSCNQNFNLRRMERYLVMIREGRATPIILLSKSDLVDQNAVQDMIAAIRNAHIDARVISFSNTSGEGIPAIEGELKKGMTYSLLGSSGVGKTTLLNHLLGNEQFETAPIREKDGRGRHTTSNRHLVVLDNGALLIDTPGMRELGIADDAEGVTESFSDIMELSAACRFKDCTHTVEAGCAILAAIERGELDEERYENYMKLVREARFHSMSYVERRQRDKQFGKMVKGILKQKKR
jgi:ribosome biogenesis GTPase / thiamine phosphate phosphatase